MNRSRPGRTACVVAAVVVALLAAACGASATPTTAPTGTAAATATAMAPSPSLVHITPAPVAAGPGPNGGTVVRWFIGLGAGTQPAQIGPEQAFATAYNASQKDVYLSLEIVDNTQAANILKTEVAAGNDAGHHRPGRRRGPEPLPRPAARPYAAHRLDRLHVHRRRSQAGRLLQARRQRRHGRRPVRRLPFVHLLQQGALRRGQACPIRRPRSATCTAASRGTSTRSAQRGHEADRRQERQ